MRIVKKRAFARIGLLGNPSDGFFGKTISTTISDFSAEVVLYEWPELEIILSEQDRCNFNRLEELVDDVRLGGLYGGLRLIKAAIKVFAEYCWEQGLHLPKQNFALRYDTDIPRQVGLAGSSAIITAVFRALMEFYGVSIQPEILANLVLSVETVEIGIAAGLQDRVCQVYEGLVYMDFSREHFEKSGYGRYELLNPGLIPPLYLAYRTDLSKISGIPHGGLRDRWERGDPDVLEAMRVFAELTEEGRDCLLRGERDRLARLMDQNFDTRCRIMRIDPRNMAMIRAARKHGVCAKFAGSGGAIVGICESDVTFKLLEEEFRSIGCVVIRPKVTGAG